MVIWKNIFEVYKEYWNVKVQEKLLHLTWNYISMIMLSISICFVPIQTNQMSLWYLMFDLNLNLMWYFNPFLLLNSYFNFFCINTYLEFFLCCLRSPTTSSKYKKDSWKNKIDMKVLIIYRNLNKKCNFISL